MRCPGRTGRAVAWPRARRGPEKHQLWSQVSPGSNRTDPNDAPRAQCPRVKSEANCDIPSSKGRCEVDVRWWPPSGAQPGPGQRSGSCDAVRTPSLGARSWRLVSARECRPQTFSRPPVRCAWAGQGAPGVSATRPVRGLKNGIKTEAAPRATRGARGLTLARDRASPAATGGRRGVRNVFLE